MSRRRRRRGTLGWGLVNSPRGHGGAGHPPQPRARPQLGLTAKPRSRPPTPTHRGTPNRPPTGSRKRCRSAMEPWAPWSPGEWARRSCSSTRRRCGQEDRGPRDTTSATGTRRGRRRSRRASTPSTPRGRPIRAGRLAAKRADKPLWRFLTDAEPEWLADQVDYRCIADALILAEALALLKRGRDGAAQRAARLRGTGCPRHSGIGWHTPASAHDGSAGPRRNCRGRRGSTCRRPARRLTPRHHRCSSVRLFRCTTRPSRSVSTAPSARSKRSGNPHSRREDDPMSAAEPRRTRSDERGSTRVGHRRLLAGMAAVRPSSSRPVPGCGR